MLHNLYREQAGLPWTRLDVQPNKLLSYAPLKKENKSIEMTLNNIEMVHMRWIVTTTLIKSITSFEFFINSQTKNGLTSSESLLVPKFKGTAF